jgi:hypothetical protein
MGFQGTVPLSAYNYERFDPDGFIREGGRGGEGRADATRVAACGAEPEVERPQVRELEGPLARPAEALTCRAAGSSS